MIVMKVPMNIYERFATADKYNLALKILKVESYNRFKE